MRNDSSTGRGGQLANEMEPDNREISSSPVNGTTRPAPAPRPHTTLCPYCGHVSANAKSCERCRGMFEPLSRQASQNAMGPWFIRDENSPFLPGFSLSTLRQMVKRGRIAPDTIIKGPSTRQFWAYARSVPGVAHLLGSCHVCKAAANAEQAACAACGTSFTVADDREHLGLTPVRLLPGHADPAQIAASGLTGNAPTASYGTSRASHDSASERGIVGLQDGEIDAAALIAARHRQRRSQRRRTIGLVTLIVVIIGLGAALVAAFANNANPASDPAGESRAPAKAQPSAAETIGVVRAPDLDLPPDEPGEDGAPFEMTQAPDTTAEDTLSRLVSATLSDLPGVIDAANVVAEEEGHDPRLMGAIEAARERLAIWRASQRL